MKKHLIFLLLLLLVISGCSMIQNEGNYAKESQDRSLFTAPLYKWGHTSNQTITIWGQSVDLNRPYMQKAFARFEEITGNTIEFRNITPQDFIPQIKDELSTPNGGEIDVLLSYGGANIDELDPDANFYDFRDAIWINDLTLTGLNQAIYHSKVIGLPHWEASISGTLYNRKIFEKHKIPIPTTQEEFLAACEKLLKKGVTPVYLPYKEPTMLLYQFPLDTIVENPQMLSALNDKRIGYTDIAEMKLIIEWYKTMSDKGYFGTDYKENTPDGMDNAMKSGEYAMMLCWDTWLYTDYTGNPKDFGLMPAFMGYPENGTFEGPNLSLMMVNKNSPELDAVLDLITFMADPYNYNYAFDGIYTSPIFTNQAKSISTPQCIEVERMAQKHFRNSIAWQRLKGFSQSDAKYIQKYMESDGSYTITNCLSDMDRARLERFITIGE